MNPTQPTASVFKFPTLLLLAIAAVFTLPSAYAVSATWNGTTNGLWATGTNWSATPVPGTLTSETATFNNAGNSNTTLDLGLGVQIRNLTFDTASAAAYTIGSGGVGAQTLTLEITGLTQLTSTVSANQTINANILLGISAIASSYTFTNNSTTNALTLAGNISGNTGGTSANKTVEINGVGNTTVSGNISNGGGLNVALTKRGTGTLTLSGNNSQTGTTTLDGGTLILNSTNAIGAGLLRLSSGTASTLISGVSDLVINNSVLAGSNTTTIGGTNAITFAGPFAGVTNASPSFTVNNTALTTISGPMALSTNAGDNANFVINGTGNVTISGNMTDGGRTGGAGLTYSGTGLLILSGTNSYSGTTTVSNGTLRLVGGASLSSGAGPLTLSGTAPVLQLYGDTGQTFNTAKTINITNTNPTATIALQGIGTNQTHTIGNVAYTPASGTSSLIVTGSNGYGLTMGNLTITGGNTTGRNLINNAEGLWTIGAISDDVGGFTGTVTFDGTGNIRVTGAITDSTPGVGLFNIVKIGANTVTLEGASSYDGTTTVSGGTLVVGNNAPSGSNGALGNATSEVVLGVAGGSNDASLLIGGAFTVGRDIRTPTSNTTDAGTRVLTLGGNTAAASVFSGNITLGTASQAGRGVTLTAASGGQVTFSGTIQNPTSMDATSYTVTKSGAGTVILTGNNTYTGNTTVSAGTLLINTPATAGNSGTGTGNVTVAAGTLGGTGVLRLTGSNTISVSSGAFLSPGDSTTGTGIGTLALDGGGTSGAVLTLTSGAKLSFELGTALSSDKLNFWNYAGVADFVRNSNVIDITFLSGATAGTYNLFNFFSGNGTTLTASGINSGLSVNFLAAPGAAGTLDYSTVGQINLVVTAVPEPATWALLAGSLTFLMIFRRRKRTFQG